MLPFLLLPVLLSLVLLIAVVLISRHRLRKRLKQIRRQNLKQSLTGMYSYAVMLLRLGGYKGEVSGLRSPSDMEAWSGLNRKTFEPAVQINLEAVFSAREPEEKARKEMEAFVQTAVSLLDSRLKPLKRLQYRTIRCRYLRSRKNGRIRKENTVEQCSVQEEK